MKRLCLRFFAPLVILAIAGSYQVNAVEITDPQEAAKDPDFLVQGEYRGEAFKNSGLKVEFGTSDRTEQGRVRRRCL